MKTILITGSSSGFGLDTAAWFLERGWKVIATMRKPREGLLPASEHLRLLPLDVTDPVSIQQAVSAAGPVDVLVNNAGVGLASVLEGTSMDAVQSLFEANVFGPMAVIRAFAPQMRERREGVIVNVSSTVTLRPLPMLSVYTATKTALNGFTESVALELAPFNVRVRLVLPGMSKDTAFMKNAFAWMEAQGVGVPEAYDSFVKTVFAGLQAPRQTVTHPQDVAQAVWRAATDPSCPVRQPAGADAIEWAAAA